jgi:hypothetical protein
MRGEWLKKIFLIGRAGVNVHSIFPVLILQSPQSQEVDTAIPISQMSEIRFRG